MFPANYCGFRLPESVCCFSDYVLPLFFKAVSHNHWFFPTNSINPFEEESILMAIRIVIFVSTLHYPFPACHLPLFFHIVLSRFFLLPCCAHSLCVDAKATKGANPRKPSLELGQIPIEMLKPHSTPPAKLRITT